jgi:hypothetical protein
VERHVEGRRRRGILPTKTRVRGCNQTN